MKKLGSILVKSSLADSHDDGNQASADEPTYIHPLPSLQTPLRAASDDEAPLGFLGMDTLNSSEELLSGFPDGSGEESEEYFENSSDEENSGSSDGEIEQIIARNHSSPSKHRSPDGGEDGADDEGHAADEGSGIRSRLKTGAKADWTRHGRSFRVRMNGTRKLTAGSLPIFLEEPAKLAEEFDTMPQNRVNIVTMPKLTEGCGTSRPATVAVYFSRCSWGVRRGQRRKRGKWAA